jgi:hypothetical protein
LPHVIVCFMRIPEPTRELGANPTKENCPLVAVFYGSCLNNKKKPRPVVPGHRARQGRGKGAEGKINKVNDRVEKQNHERVVKR